MTSKETVPREGRLRQETRAYMAEPNVDDINKIISSPFEIESVAYFGGQFCGTSDEATRHIDIRSVE
ncbi:MAG: hypothetical protein HPY55_09080 [Firmicutes bacterium]|nr:hypothetical protein [Bacillota bacterium]